MKRIVAAGFLVVFIGACVTVMQAGEKPEEVVLTDDVDGAAVILVASDTPVQSTGYNYRESVILVMPVEGTHVGLVLNHETQTTPGMLFPTDEPARRLTHHVYQGGPFQLRRFTTLKRSAVKPGSGSLRVTDGLYFVSGAKTIDSLIAKAPLGEKEDIKFFTGLVIWESGDLLREIDAGCWRVIKPSGTIALRQDVKYLWKDLSAKIRFKTDAI